MLPGWYVKNPKRFWMPLGLLFYGVLVFLFFLVWTFPYRLLENRLIIALETALSSRIEIGHETFLFPLGLRLERVALFTPGRVSPWLIDRVQARASVAPLLLGLRGEVDWSMTAMGGEASGHLRIMRRGKWLHVRVEDTHANLELAGLYKGVKGRANLELQGEWTEQTNTGKGEARLKGENLVIEEIPGVVLPILPLSLSSLTGRIIFKKNGLFLEGISGRGEIIDFSGGGNILVRNSYSKSPLSLSFRVSPKGELAELAGIFLGKNVKENPLRVNVTGTVGAPKIQVDGMRVN